MSALFLDCRHTASGVFARFSLTRRRRRPERVLLAVALLLTLLATSTAFSWEYAAANYTRLRWAPNGQSLAVFGRIDSGYELEDLFAAGSFVLVHDLDTSHTVHTGPSINAHLLTSGRNRLVFEDGFGIYAIDLSDGGQQGEPRQLLFEPNGDGRVRHVLLCASEEGAVVYFAPGVFESDLDGAPLRELIVPDDGAAGGASVRDVGELPEGCSYAYNSRAELVEARFPRVVPEKRAGPPRVADLDLAIRYSWLSKPSVDEFLIPIVDQSEARSEFDRAVKGLLERRKQHSPDASPKAGVMHAPPRYTIQLASGSDYHNAIRFAGGLSWLGLEPRVEQVSEWEHVPGGGSRLVSTRFKVRIGAFVTRDQAEVHLAELLSEHRDSGLQGWVDGLVPASATATLQLVRFGHEQSPDGRHTAYILRGAPGTHGLGAPSVRLVDNHDKSERILIAPITNTMVSYQGVSRPWPLEPPRGVSAGVEEAAETADARVPSHDAEAYSAEDGTAVPVGTGFEVRAFEGFEGAFECSRLRPTGTGSFQASCTGGWQAYAEDVYAPHRPGDGWAWRRELDAHSGSQAIRGSTDGRGMGILWLFKTFEVMPGRGLRVSARARTRKVHSGRDYGPAMYVFDGAIDPPSTSSGSVIGSSIFVWSQAAWSEWTLLQALVFPRGRVVTVALQVRDAWGRHTVFHEFDTLRLEERIGASDR